MPLPSTPPLSLPTQGWDGESCISSRVRRSFLKEIPPTVFYLQSGFLGSLLIEVRHEDLDASLWGHASVAINELSLVVDEVEVKPGILGRVDHREIDVVHGEVPEVERAPLRRRKLCHLARRVSSLPALP